MKKNTTDKLDNIVGGTVNITSSFINAFTNIIKVLMDAGHEFGSAIRRISEDSICPLK